uniref:Uncharacterized protein n=1 Tax=Rhizophora mucronata TaxID=61149 RepID=A0A2P2JP13_RHIMU
MPSCAELVNFGFFFQVWFMVYISI